MSSGIPFPRDFLCEHTPSKSRVFAAFSSPDQPDTLKAVLTCTNPLLAQRAESRAGPCRTVLPARSAAVTVTPMRVGYARGWHPWAG